MQSAADGITDSAFFYHFLEYFLNLFASDVTKEFSFLIFFHMHSWAAFSQYYEKFVIFHLHIYYVSIWCSHCIASIICLYILILVVTVIIISLWQWLPLGYFSYKLIRLYLCSKEQLVVTLVVKYCFILITRKICLYYYSCAAFM